MSYKITRRGNVTTFTGTGRDIGKSFATTKKGSAATARFRSILKAKGQKLDIIPTTEPLRTGEYFEQAEKAEARQVGISQSKPVLIPIKNVRGQIIGVRDTTNRQSIRVIPGSITQRQLNISEGIADIRARQPLRIKDYMIAPKIRETTETILPESQRKLSFLESQAFLKREIRADTLAEKKALLQRATTWVAKAKGREELREIRAKQTGANRIIKGAGILAVFGAIRGGLALASAVVHPGVFTKSQAMAIRHAPTTIRTMVSQFGTDPIGFVVEYRVFIKGVGFIGRAVKSAPISHYVVNELFIRRAPKPQQKFIRAVLNSEWAQRAINPKKVGKITSANFAKIETFKGLSKNEIKAIMKTISETKSVIFGSFVTKLVTGTKGKSGLAHDLDLATPNIQVFYKRFIKNMPKSMRKKYKMQGQKLLRDGSKIMDVKPLDRLIQQKNVFTGKGKLPVTGFAKRFKIREFTKVNVNYLKVALRKTIKDLQALIPTKQFPRVKIQKALKKAKSLLRLAKTKGLKSNKVVQALEEAGELGKLTIPKLKKGLEVTLEIPTQRLTKVSGIRLIRFSEQVSRKGLGTLQVLIEKSARRAKDPQSFVTLLEVQLKSLKSLRRTPIIKAKIRIISNALKTLKSKEFAKMLDKSVPELSKKFPLVAKINVKKLRKVNRNVVLREVKKRAVTKTDIKNIKRLSKKNKLTIRETLVYNKLIRKTKLTPRETSIYKKLSKKNKLTIIESNQLNTLVKKAKSAGVPRSSLPSNIPSKLVKSRLPSRLPSKIPKSRKPSKMPSKMPSLSKLFKNPSKLPIIKSIIPISKLITSRLPPSRLPPRRPSRIPPSKLPPRTPSRLPPGKTTTKPPKKTKPKIFKEEQKRKKLLKLLKKELKKDKFIYIPDLYSSIYGIYANPKEKRMLLRKGAVFSGVDIRKRI